MKRLITALLLILGSTAYGQCPDPDTVTNNNVTLITATTARVNGTQATPTANQTIVLRYVRSGFTDTVSATGAGVMRNLTGLQPSTLYKYYYRTLCSDGRTDNQASYYTFTTLTSTVLYVAERPTVFQYLKTDTGGIAFVPSDTLEWRTPTDLAIIKYKSSNSTFYGYYPSCLCWRPLATDSAGIIAQLDLKVDSVTVSGDSLFWWNNHGVSHGYILPALDNVWKLDGSNTGASHVLGTSDANGFTVETNGVQRMSFSSAGLTEIMNGSSAMFVSSTGVGMEGAFVEINPSDSLMVTGLTNLSTQDRLLGIRNSNGRVGNITLGTGLALSSGVLSNSGLTATPTLQQVIDESNIGNQINLTGLGGTFGTTGVNIGAQVNDVFQIAQHNGGFGAGINIAGLSATRTYTLPDASGTIALVGGSGVGTVTGTGTANRGAYWDGTSSITSTANWLFDGTTHTLAANGAASTSTLLLTGNPSTAGTTTTDYPLMYMNGGTAPTTWSTNGTYTGWNAVSGFTGNFMDTHVNGGASLFKVNYQGNVSLGTTGTTLSSSLADLQISNSTYATTVSFRLLPYLGDTYFDIYDAASGTPTGAQIFRQTYTGSASRENMRVSTGGNLGIGTGATVSARLHTISTTEQLRIGYDASNYYSTTVGSTGGVTLDAVGSGALFTISDGLTITGTTTLNGAIAAADGANKSVGVSAAMTAGTITISNTRVTASSRIFLTHATLGGVQGILSVGTITAGTSFVINSSSAADTGTVNWWIIN